MKILIVDDSALMRAIIKTFLNAQSDMEVIGEASNGQRAVEMNSKLSPDFIIMDIIMPIMDGLEATRQIMQEKPTAIIVFSGDATAENSFQAMNMGALDIMQKPDIDTINDPVFQKDFLSKIRILGKKRLFHEAKPSKTPGRLKSLQQNYNIVVIGASTGGPVAVRELLEELPENFPVGIALIQHLETGFDQGYASWLNESSPLTVKLAQKSQSIVAGEVIIAPVNKHLIIKDDYLILDDRPKVLNQKPSVDVLFETAAQNFREHTLGVLLTGMGRDGAAGCVSIVNKGGKTLVQDEATSAIFGMPKAAIEMGGASKILPLNQMAQMITSLVTLKNS